MGKPCQLEDFLQRGTSQVAAGYIIYGSSTMLVYTAGHGVFRVYGIIITYLPGDLGKGYEATKKKIREEGEKALSSMNENEKSQSEQVK